MKATPERPRSARRKRAADRIWYGLWVICAALFVADFLYHKHGHFSMEEWPQFFSVAGFASYSFIVFSAFVVRRLVMRGEDYYDE